MGEAKRRGTYKQRKAAAIARDRAAEKKRRKLVEEQSTGIALPQRARRGSGHLVMSLAIASALAIHE